MTRSRLEPMDEFAGPAYAATGGTSSPTAGRPCTNAILEGLNSVIQNVKTRAHGCKNMGYFSTIGATCPAANSTL